MLVGNSLWYLISQADMMSKGVLLALLIMSLVCWTLFFAKLILFRIKRKQLSAVQKKAQMVNSIDELSSVADAHVGTIGGYFLSKNAQFLKKLSIKQSAHSIPLMHNYTDQIIDSIMMHEESYLSVLSTSAAVAPLLGLFGTVWGLVHSFLSISQKQSADITTVAPGIAEALMTTIVGLMVAIPALIMYNVLQGKLRMIEQYVMRLADHVGQVVVQVLG